MDPQLTALLDALVWHQKILSYLLVGLIALSIAGFWSLGSMCQQIHRETSALLRRDLAGPNGR